jgi:hypothetical protein
VPALAGQRRPGARHAGLGRGVPGQAQPQRRAQGASCSARARLAPIWHDYGIRPQGTGFEHSAYVLLIDKRGRQRQLPVEQLVDRDLAHDIRKLEAEPA